MNRYKLSVAGIDVSEGIHRFGGNKQLYEKFLYGFPTDSNYRKMLDAIENSNAEDAFQAGHALKGISGNLSLIKLHQALIPIVDLFRSGSLENYEVLLTPVKESYDSVIEALRE